MEWKKKCNVLKSGLCCIFTNSNTIGKLIVYFKQIILYQSLYLLFSYFISLCSCCCLILYCIKMLIQLIVYANQFANSNFERMQVYAS